MIPQGAPSYSNQAPTNAITGGGADFDLATGYFSVGGGGDIGTGKNFSVYAIMGTILIIGLVALKGK